MNKKKKNTVTKPRATKYNDKVILPGTFEQLIGATVQASDKKLASSAR